MLGVAFELRRAPEVILGEKRHSQPADGHGGGVEQGPSRNDLLRLPDVGDELLVRLARAGADARQRERRAHQLQELTSTGRVVELGSLRRKLALDVLADLRSVRELLQAAPETAPLEAFESRTDISEVHSGFSHL